jgi:DeoR family transcriptional regulator of aga operon
MMQTARRELIAAELAQHRFMSVETIAERFKCSAATARRDLQALAAEGRIRRSRGGALASMYGRTGLEAVAPGGPDHDPLLETKRRIGQAVAAMVKEGDTIGIGGGTTALEVARCLRGRRIGVITNAIDTALELASPPGPRIVLVGGLLDYANGRELVGPLAEMMLGQLTMDALILGVNGIDLEAGATVFGEFDAQVLRVMCGRARRVIIVADHTKIGRASLAGFLPVDGIHTFVTDGAAESAALAAFRAAGVQVVAA